jgi:hypothetical protein
VMVEGYGLEIIMLRGALPVRVQNPQKAWSPRNDWKD